MSWLKSGNPESRFLFFVIKFKYLYIKYEVSTSPYPRVFCVSCLVVLEDVDFEFTFPVLGQFFYVQYPNIAAVRYFNLIKQRKKLQSIYGGSFSTWTQQPYKQHQK